METNEKKNERVYLSQQLVCMLPPLVLKVMMYLIGWQSRETIKYYEKQMCGFLHIEPLELELSIETLINLHLIIIEQGDDVPTIKLNKEVISKYYNVPFEKVKEHKGFELATEVTWKKDEKKDDEMSDEELKRTILRLQSMLSEREQTKQMVRTTAASSDDGLPW